MATGLTAREMFRPGGGRNGFGEYRRATEDRPMTAARRAKYDKDVARVMAAAAQKHGPADNPDDVVAQRMYLVRSGLMSAREAFARGR